MSWVLAPGKVSAQNTMSISTDGRWVAYAEHDTLRIAAVDGSTGPRVIGGVKSYYAVPRWSPKSDQLAFYSTASGSSQLWLYDVSRGVGRQLTAVTGGIDPDPLGRFFGWVGDPLRFAWSADGTTIAFTHRVPVEESTSQRSTESDRAAAVPGDTSTAGRPLVLTLTTPATWTLLGVIRSHSGRTISKGQWAGIDDTQLRSRSGTQLFLLEVRTGQVRQLTSDTVGYFTPDWSPDGRQLAYMSPEGRSLAGFGPEESNIHVLDLRSGRSRRVTSGQLQKSLPRWSADGELIAYMGGTAVGRDGQGVYVVPANGTGLPRRVTTRVNRYISSYAWAPDGVSLLVTYHDGIAQPLARVEVVTGEMTLVAPQQAVVEDLAASQGATAWVQTVDPNAPTALWVQQRTERSPRSLLDVVPAPDPRTARRQEAVGWRNSRGEEIEGILIYPVGYERGRPYPTIVDTYSGFQNTRHDEYNLIKVSSRYIVFLPNHRAPHMWVNPMKSATYDSAGVGRKGIAVMVDDVLSGVDTLVRRGISDPGRLCVFGFSNGGLEGEQLLTQTDRFKCAVLQSPSTSDWALQFFLSTDNPEVVRWMYGIPPWEDPALYTALVPLYHADRIKTPVLLAVGDKEDLRLLATIEMYNALRYLGRDVTLLRYADQGHGFTGLAEEDFEARVRAFFAKYLGS